MMRGSKRTEPDTEAPRRGEETLYNHSLICGKDFIKQFFDDVPEDERRRFVLKRDCLTLGRLGVRILKVRATEISMVFILMPPSMEFCVRIAVVDAKPIVWCLAIPRDFKLGSLGSSRWCETIRIEDRTQAAGFDCIRKILDGRNVGNPFENIVLELFVQVGVRIASWMWNGHPLVTGLHTLSTGC